MPEVGVRITGDAVEFINAIKRVEKQTEDFKRSFETRMQSIASATKTAIAAFMGFQGLSGLVAFTSSMDKVVKDAGALGVAADVYVELAEKADMAGVGSEVLRAALSKLQRSLIEARAGSGEAATALAELGLTAEELLRLPLDERLRRIIAAMQELGQEERAAAAVALFGKSGQELLKLSPEALAGQKGPLGTAFAGIGDQGTRAIEKLSDAFTILQNSAKTVGVLFVNAIAPSVEAISNAVASFSKFLSENASVVVVTMRVSLALAAAFMAWRGVIMVVTAAMMAYRAAMVAVAAVKAFLMTLTMPVAGALAVVAATAAATSAVAAMQMTAVAGSAEEAKAGLEAVGSAAANVGNESRGMAVLAQVAAGTSRAAREAAEAIRQLDERMAKTQTERARTAQLAVDINVPAFAVDIEAQFNEVRDKTQAKVKEIRDAISQLEPEFKRLKEVVSNMKLAMGVQFGRDDQTRALENQLSQVGGRLAQLREQEAAAQAQLARLEETRAQALRATAATEANKRIRELNEQVDKLLGKDFDRFLAQLERAGLGAQSGEMESLMKARAARDIAEVAKSAKDLADELARSAQENELLARGFTQQEARLHMLRKQLEGMRPEFFLDPERARLVREQFDQAAQALRRFGEAQLLRQAAEAVNHLRDAASGIPPAFADAARNAALLDIAVQKGLINAQEQGRLMEILFDQVGQNIFRNFSQLRPVVRGSVEEARLILQQQAQGQARDLAREILPQLASLAKQQLETQNRIAAALERRQPEVAGVVP